jgi:hypothetical protein
MKWLLLGLAACSGDVGTLSLSLATAPGSHILDDAQTLRLTLTNPHQVTTAARGANGFSIELDLPANGATGSVIVEALDAGGNRIAVGQSPPLPFGAINATIVIYMAAPNSVGAAPATLSPARSDIGIGALSYGAVIAGGRDAAGAPADAIAIYNSFDHSVTAGLALPAPRSGLAVGVGGGNAVYLFGGSAAGGAPADSLWRFDTTVAPSGSYADFGTKAGFARADQLLVPLGNDHFLVTGTPAAELAGLDGSVVTRTEVSSLPAAGAAVVGSDGVAAAIFAGDAGIQRYRSGAFDTVDATAHTGASVVALPGGSVAVVCGSAPGARVDAATGMVTALPAVPAMARTGCAAAATARHLVIAGGTGALDSVEIFDATTLAPVATATLTVPRTGASAVALPDGQVLIAGGTDGSGAPIETLELFTPAPSE